MGWMSQGGHSEPLLLLALFYQSTPSCLKVGGGVAHEILVSAQGPFLGFWVWGLRVWGLGLTTSSSLKFMLGVVGGGVVVGGPCDFRVSISPFGLDFWT